MSNLMTFYLPHSVVFAHQAGALNETHMHVLRGNFHFRLYVCFFLFPPPFFSHLITHALTSYRPPYPFPRLQSSSMHTPRKASSRVPLTPLAVQNTASGFLPRSSAKNAPASAASSSSAALSKAKLRVQSLEKQLSQATKLQAAAKSETRALAIDFAEQQESRVAFERETNRVLGLYNELQKEGKELYHAYSSKAAKAKTLSRHVTNLQEQLRIVEHDNQTLVDAVEAAEDKSAALCSENAGLRSRIGAVVADRAAAEQETQTASAKIQELEAAVAEQEDEFHSSVASASALSEANAALQAQVGSLTADMDRLEKALDDSSAHCEALTHRLTAELVDRGLATASAMVYELKAQESYDESMERLRLRLGGSSFGTAPASDDAAASGFSPANATHLSPAAAAVRVPDFTALAGSRDSIESWGTWDGAIADEVAPPSPAKVVAEIAVQTSPLAASNVLGHLATVSTTIATNTAMAPIIVVDSFTPDRRRRLANSPQTPAMPALPCIVVEHSTPSAVARKPGVQDSSTSPMAAAATSDSCTSPLQDATPANTSSTETMTSPRSPAADFMVLAQGGSPQALLHQIESVTISNEVLREHHAHLAGEAAKKDAKIASLEAEMNASSAALQKAASAREGAEAALAEAKEQFAFNHEETAMLHSDAIETLSATVAAKDIELGDINLEFAELSENVEAIKAQADKVTAMSFDLDHLRAELERADAASSDKEQAVAQATAAGQQNFDVAEALRAANTSLEMQVRAKQQECADLEADFQIQLKQQQATNRNLSDDLRMVYNKNKAAIADLTTQFKHDDYKGRYSALLSENQKLRATVEHIKCCFAELQATSQLQERAAAELSAVYAGVVQKLAGVEVARGNDRTEMARLREEHDAISMVNQQIDGACKTLEAEKERVVAACTALDNQCSDLRVEKNAFEQQIDEMEGDLAKMQLSADELGALRDDHASLVTELDAAQQLALGTETENTLRLAELESLQESQATLAAELDAARKETVAAQSNGEAQLAEATAKSATLATQLEAVRNKYNELSEFVEEERMIRSDLVEEMEKDMLASQEEVEQLKVMLDERTQMIEACKQELDAAVTQAESELSCAMEEVEAARDQVDAYKLAGAQEAQEESEAMIAELRAEVCGKTSIIEELGGELCSKELAIVEVELSAEKLKETLESTAAKERSTMQASFLRYKEQSEEKIAILRENLSKAELEVTFLDTELTKIQG